MSNLFVVCMGVGTVFVGLILLVGLTYILGAICRPKEKKEPLSKPISAEPDSGSVPSEKRGEIIAAVSAVLAEEMGTDVSALRIHSFRKI